MLGWSQCYCSHSLQSAVRLYVYVQSLCTPDIRSSSLRAKHSSALLLSRVLVLVVLVLGLVLLVLLASVGSCPIWGQYAALDSTGLSSQFLHVEHRHRQHLVKLGPLRVCLQVNPEWDKGALEPNESELFLEFDGGLGSQRVQNFGPGALGH